MIYNICACVSKYKKRSRESVFLIIFMRAHIVLLIVFNSYFFTRTPYIIYLSITDNSDLSVRKYNKVLTEFLESILFKYLKSTYCKYKVSQVTYFSQYILISYYFSHIFYIIPVYLCYIYNVYILLLYNAYFFITRIYYCIM